MCAYRIGALTPPSSQSFANLVLDRFKGISREAAASALARQVALLPAAARAGLEAWTQEITGLCRDPSFMRADATSARTRIYDCAARTLSLAGAEASPGNLEAMFQIALLQQVVALKAGQRSSRQLKQSVDSAFMRRLR